MKKALSILFGASLLFSGAQNLKPCWTDEAMKAEFDRNPQLKQEFLEREAALEKQDAIDFQNGYGLSANGKTQMLPVYIIPVVFHILHQYGTENISDAQVYDAVSILNEDYRKLNADISNVVPAFQSIAADAEIEFRLATKDPNGNCTNGIVRHVDANTNWPNSSSAYAYTGTGAGKWNPTKYLNVYVVKSISSGAAGYTYLPGTWSSGNAQDAIVILNSYVGSIGTGNPNTSRALTHEVGHWFNLAHVWGSTNQPGVSCGNDGVTDTPVTKGYYSQCPLSACSICSSTVEENVQNYMEYSYCSNMFTAGQKTRMRNALGLNTVGRSNLWSTTNLSNTGVNPVNGVCAPVADFDWSTDYACTNANVTFSDLSWNGQPTSWNWSFPGGTPSTSTDSFPVIQYASPGVYSASLTVSNAAGSNTVSKSSIITIFNSTASYQSGWQESFETSAIPNSDWTVKNNGGVTWTRTSNAAVTGTYSMYLQNTSNTGTSIDDAISPGFNIAALGSPTLSFKVAHAQKNSGQLDNLKMYVSTNCGQTWVLKYNKTGSSLQTLGTGVYQSTAFTPTSSQWRTENININNILFYSNVMLKFTFICDSSGAGNNIYIDDINLNGTTTGIGSEIDNTINFFVAPNPSNGQAFVNFSIVEKSKVSVFVTDMLGRKIEDVGTADFETGDYRLNVGEKAHYSAGIYFVNLRIGEKFYSTKMLIE
jgi:PKD repeat protein